MNKRRKYDLKSKRGMIIILIVSIVIIGVFSLFIYRYSKASKILYVIESGSILQDVNNNFLTIDDDMELKIRWNGNYYIVYNDKNVNLGKKVITYNTITGSMNLYGAFYEIKKDGKIVEFRNETELPNTTIPKFYKIDDRKYLVIDNKITSEDYSIEANNYLLIELDKVGNAKLSNNKLNLKTITPTKLITSEYVFDIANEILKFGEYSIDLKKIIGSTNQYVENTKAPSSNQSGGTGTGTGTGGAGGDGTGTGTGTGTGSGNGTGGGGDGIINGADTGKIPPVEELLNKVKMTSIIRIVEGITQIDIDYVIYDPFNEYVSVYVEVISPDKMEMVYLSKTETHLTLKNLEANTNYKLNFIYTTAYTDSETGVSEAIPYTFESFDIKTKMPEYAISVYKISQVYNTLTYKVDLQSGYTISKVNVNMTFEHSVTDPDSGEVTKEVISLDDSVSVPETGTKYITGSFNIVSYNIDSDTLLKLTVKSVEVGGKELPINTSSSFRFGR